MKMMMKWGGIALGIMVVLVIGAMVLVPRFVDVQQYKPQIEALVTEQTGRSFSMGDDIKLSVFPWVGVSLSDLVLGNAPGFKAKEMISVGGFEVRLKVLPLLSRRVEVATFVMDTPRIFLEKNKEGMGNWENIGPAKAPGKKAEAPKGGEQGADPESGGMPIQSLMVGHFSILKGLVSYSDQAGGLEKQVSDFNLDLKDISLDKPISIELSALVDGQPLSLAGQVGPLGKDPGKTDMEVDIVLKALDVLELKVKGKLIDPAGNQKFAMDIDLATFSPRQLFERLGQPFPMQTSDPKALDSVSLKVRVDGSPTAVSLSGGELGLDDSSLSFTAKAKAFSKPDIQFDLSLDQIDLDRYLPPAPEKQNQEKQTQASAGTSAGKESKPDYGPLRKLVLDGKAEIGKLKAANLRMENIKVHVIGKNGVFNLDPFSMDLYDGSALVQANLDVRKNDPVTKISLDAKGIQAGPMIKDAAQKEIIEGTLAADVALNMKGDGPETVKQSLTGKGDLTFLDGAIVGIDIPGAIRNVSSGLGLGEKPATKPKTDFAELKIPFTADKGLVQIPGASLVSPLLRLLAQGKTNLVREDLDFRVEPKLVATLKGQGDAKDRSGLLVPLLITGTYASPKVRPDLKAMVTGQLPDGDSIKKVLEGTPGESTEDKAKSLIKGLFK